MAGWDKKARRLRSLSALFEDAGGPVQRPMADPGSPWGGP